MNSDKIMEAARLLHKGGLSIHTYDLDKALQILQTQDSAYDVIQAFEKNTFEVFLELMKIQVG